MEENINILKSVEKCPDMNYIDHGLYLVNWHLSTHSK